MSTAAFIRDLRRDPLFADADGAIFRQLDAALEAIDLEGDENPDANECHRAVQFVLSQPLSAGKKFEVLNRLLLLEKVENLDVRAFIGQ